MELESRHVYSTLLGQTQIAPHRFSRYPTCVELTLRCLTTPPLRSTYLGKLYSGIILLWIDICRIDDQRVTAVHICNCTVEKIAPSYTLDTYILHTCVVKVESTWYNTKTGH